MISSIGVTSINHSEPNAKSAACAGLVQSRPACAAFMCDTPFHYKVLLFLEKCGFQAHSELLVIFHPVYSHLVSMTKS